MQYEESYFQGEEREGFYIAPMMKRYWAAQMEVLEVIDKICKLYGIKYFAFYGTLLGAVRHKGFIPWDDDMDLCMLRDDYDRFHQIAPDVLPKGYHILSAKEDEYGTLGVNGLFMRIVNSNEIDISKERLDRYHGCPYVVGIDIFVQDYVPRNEDDLKLRNNMFDIIAGTARLLETGKLSGENLEENLCAIEEMCKHSLNRSKPLVGQLYYLADRVSAMYTREEADYVSIVRHRMHSGETFIRKEEYDEIIRVPFENMMIPIPKQYHNSLVMGYGSNYMTPIQGLGAGHEYPAYKSQERVIIERFGELPECIRYE